MTGESEQITETVAQIRLMLAGRPPEVQGGALADCLALWLAGHYVVGDAEATRRMRAKLLTLHWVRVHELYVITKKANGYEEK